MHSMAVHVEAMLALQKKGAVTFDYGNNIRAQAKKAGVEKAFDHSRFVPNTSVRFFARVGDRSAGSR